MTDQARCKVCRHPLRVGIDQALILGEGVRSIAMRFGGISKSALFDHKKEGHIPETLSRAADAATVADADALMARVKWSLEELARLARSSEKGGDNRGAGQMHGQLIALYKLMAELEGRIKNRTEVNLVIAPQWIELQGRILGALRPFPEARAAVVRALTESRALPPVIEAEVV